MEQLEQLGSTISTLGECPLWNIADERLYWIDIDGRAVHRIDPGNATIESRTLPGRPGSMVLTADNDRFVVAMEHELVELVWSTGVVTSLITLEDEGPGKRLNDGRCDRQGRFWVGSMDDPPSAGEGRGRLHRVDATSEGLVATEHRSGIGVSNGCAFSPDGRTMYWADTRRSTVWAYDYDPDTGDRHNERIFLDFADLPGGPDGACVDADGCYWVACVNGWALLRATPDGTVDRIIDVPVKKPTMPAFGGSGLDTLFLTSINDGEGELAGALFAVDVGVTGLPEPPFAV